MYKVPYATEENIRDKARVWLEALPVRKKWSAEIKYEESALIVVDMQNFFLLPESHAYLPAGEAIVPGINRLVEQFNSGGGKVIYTRTVQDTHGSGTMSQWWHSSPVTEGPMARIHDDIKVDGPVVVKSTYSSFHRTNIGDHLKGICNIFICGVMTDLCCETTCREAFVRDHRTFFIADATATINEKIHLSSLISMCYGIAEVLSCKDVEQRLR